MIQTNVARCRDCYSCVRACSVKAVRVQDAQAQVVQELCIVCGTCVRACPQGAKQVRNDRSIVEQALAEGRPVVASVAPSAPAFFDLTSFVAMEEALQALGFAAAGETAFGAEMVGRAHGRLLAEGGGVRPVIAAACPVVVNLVEMYYPDLIVHLAPIVSPMIAHGRWLRRHYGPTACIVFIGPCLGKKGEVRAEGLQGAVDAALTFSELAKWLKERGIAIARPAEPPEPEPVRPAARLFPVEGGLVGTARLSTDMLAEHVITASGLEACRDVLEGIRSGALEAGLAELMACEGGCINGPVMAGLHPVSLYRQRLLAYAGRQQPQPLPTGAARRGGSGTAPGSRTALPSGDEDWPDLSRSFHDRSQPVPEFSEEEIRAALAMVEKYSPQDELNCGACGYPSCRAKAIAALRGMAELTMCIPYMRSRAESLTNVVMDAVPNAVLVVDEQLHVHEASASAQRMFGRHRGEMLGRHLREFVPVLTLFLQAQGSGEMAWSEKVRLREGLIVDMAVVPVPGKGLLVSVLRDITEHEAARAALAHLRAETLDRTQAVIKKQMRVAHEIAGLLGETTAETKVLLTELRRLLEKDEDGEAAR
ncbi:MAG TPA: [Fe-Fe] hydrogenase large subunit C-terminal domain-containing protein [Anaerolineae bacterium]|nr:[Fe-Fe] hydrogenase large subunit C-terminal domain-containing protein [Anaerolineae bacterium]